MLRIGNSFSSENSSHTINNDDTDIIYYSKSHFSFSLIYLYLHKETQFNDLLQS